MNKQEKHSAGTVAQEGGAEAWVITDGDVRIVRLAEHVEPHRLLGVDAAPLYGASIVETLRAQLEEREARVGVLTDALNSVNEIANEHHAARPAESKLYEAGCIARAALSQPSQPAAQEPTT